MADSYFILTDHIHELAHILGVDVSMSFDLDVAIYVVRINKDFVFSEFAVEYSQEFPIDTFIQNVAKVRLRHLVGFDVMLLPIDADHGCGD